MSSAVKNALDRVNALRQKVKAADEDMPGLAKLTPKQKKVYKKLKETGAIYTDMLPVLGITFEEFLRLGQMPKAHVDKGVQGIIAEIEKVGFARLGKNRKSRAAVSAAKADKATMKALIDAWLETDLKLDKTHGGGYVPSKGVLAQRERHRQKEEVDAIGEKLFKKQYASEWEGNKGIWVTYRDNRNRETWEEKLAELIAAAQKAGYRTRTRNDSNVILFNQKKVKAMEAAYDEYVKALAEAGSKGARKALGLPPQPVHTSGKDVKPAHKQEAGEVTYEVVGLSRPIKVKSKEELVKLLKKAGIKMTGVNNNARQRAELQGQPKFDKLLGPMYNGKNSIRYETQEAYNQFSAATAIQWREVGDKILGAEVAVRPGRRTYKVALRIDAREKPVVLDKMSLGPWEAIGRVSSVSAAKKLAKKWMAAAEEQETLTPNLKASVVKAGKDVWKKLQEDFPNWPLEELKQAVGSSSPYQSAEGRKVNKAYKDLRKKGYQDPIYGKVRAAKDTGTPKKDKKRQSELEEVITKAAALREAVDMGAFPEVDSACKAVDALAELASDLREAQVKLKAAKAKTEEAEQAQQALDELRARVDSMLTPLKATMDTMETLVVAAAALAEKFDLMQSEAEAMESKLKGEKERLAAIADAVRTTAKMG